jgi:hypothetical protein
MIFCHHFRGCWPAPITCLLIFSVVLSRLWPLLAQPRWPACRHAHLPDSSLFESSVTISRILAPPTPSSAHSAADWDLLMFPRHFDDHINVQFKRVTCLLSIPTILPPPAARLQNHANTVDSDVTRAATQCTPAIAPGATRRLSDEWRYYYRDVLLSLASKKYSNGWYFGKFRLWVLSHI